MLRIFRYIKNLFVRKQANVKVISPKEHEQKPYKHIAKVAQDILIHRPVTNKFVQDRIRSNDVYNHVTPVASVSQNGSTESDQTIYLSPENLHWLNNDDSDSKRHNHSDNNDYHQPSHVDNSHSHSDYNHSHSHHDYSPSHDSGSSYQSDSTSYDSGSSGSSDW